MKCQLKLMPKEIRFPSPEAQNEKLHARNSLGHNPRERSAADDPSAVCGRFILVTFAAHICSSGALDSNCGGRT